MRPNRLRELLTAGKPTLGTHVIIPWPGVIEIIGHYNPRTEPGTVMIKENRALYWLMQGAQPSKAVARMLRNTGIAAKYEALKAGEEVEIETGFVSPQKAAAAAEAAAAESEAETEAEETAPEEAAAEATEPEAGHPGAAAVESAEPEVTEESTETKATAEAKAVPESQIEEEAMAEEVKTEEAETEEAETE